MSESQNQSKQCSGCGKGLPFSDEKYVYCDQCERERTDKNVSPKVIAYIGGESGYLRNKRGTSDYNLRSMGFKEFGEVRSKIGQLNTYTREADNTPLGLVAMKTVDDVIVIFDGKDDFDAFVEDNPAFFDNPVAKNLPNTLKFSLHPEKADFVKKLRKDAGLDN